MSSGIQHTFRMAAALGVAASLLSTAALAVPENARKVEEIVAKVNDDVIVRSEYVEALTPEIARLRERNKNAPDAFKVEVEQQKEATLKQIIEYKLLEQEAIHEKIEVHDGDVEEAILSIMEQNKIPSKEAFFAKIEESGQSIESYKEDLKKQLQVMRLRNKEFRRSVTVLDREIEQYYKQNQESFQDAGEATVKWLQVPADPQDMEGSRAKAASLREQSLQGADWDTLILENSVGPFKDRGGLLGTIGQGQIQEVFETAIFALKAPGITEPLEYQGYWHVFNVTAITPPRVKPLEDVRAAITRIVTENKVDARARVWLDQVYTRSYVFVYRDRIFGDAIPFELN